MGAKWLRNGQDGVQAWSSGDQNGDMHDDRSTGMMGERFQETEGTIAEIQGIEGLVTIKKRAFGDREENQKIYFVEEMDEGGKHNEPEFIVVETKRKRVDNGVITGNKEIEKMIFL